MLLVSFRNINVGDFSRGFQEFVGIGKLGLGLGLCPTPSAYRRASKCTEFLISLVEIGVGLLDSFANVLVLLVGFTPDDVSLQLRN